MEACCCVDNETGALSGFSVPEYRLAVNDRVGSIPVVMRPPASRCTLVVGVACPVVSPKYVMGSWLKL